MRAIARHGGEPLDLVSGHDDREAVRDDAVAPADLCLRQRVLDPRLERVLGRGERAEVRARGRRAQAEPAAAGRGEGAPRARDRERLGVERDDDLDERLGACSVALGTRRCGQREQQERQEKGDPAHGRPG